MKFNTILGLDIKPDAIRFVKLSHHQGQFIIEGAHETHLPGNLFENEKIVDWDHLTLLLENIISKHHLENAAVATSLPARLVNMQKIALPAGQSDAAIFHEINRHIGIEEPALPSKYAIDFALLKPEFAHYSSIYFAGTHQDYLSAFLACLTDAGLRVKIMDIDIYAMTRSLQYELQLSMTFNTRYLSIYVLETSVLLIAFDQERIYFYQEADHVGIDIPVQIMEFLQSHQILFQENNIDCMILIASAKWLAECSDIFKNAELEVLVNGLCSKKRLISNWQRCNQNRHQQSFLSNPLNFITAFGLAMRALPAW